MSRVIQDSDDDMEDELEIEIEPHHSDKDASPKHSDTSSTEALRQQIEAAHRAHLQSQLSIQDGHTSATFEVNPQKRKLPTNFDSNSASNEASRSQVVTDDIPLNDTSGSQHAFQQPVIDSFSHSAQPTDGADWLLEGTMRDAYVEHDPNAMFPDASSTVPNATLTQQRVMNGILAPAFLGSDVDTERAPYQPDASIPWSEYLRSPTDTAEHPKSSTKEPGNGSSLSTLGRQQPKSQELLSCPPTQCSPRASMNARGFTLSSNGGPPSQETIQHAQPQREGTSSSSVTTTQGEAQSSSRQTVKKKRSLSPGQGSEDDLADLGVPKEQYLPRPSRSRSSRVDIQEIMDYSIRPEKAARTTRRGRSSPRSSHDMISLSTPDRIRQICEMGFTPSTSARALRKNNGDVTQTVDWLITNRIADDELLSHTSRMSNIDDERPGEGLGGQKGHNFDTASGTLEAFTVPAPNPEVKSPLRVQVVIPARLPDSVVETSYENFKRKKAKPAPTPTDDAPEAIKVEKKRGRGRPKKTVKASYSEDVIQAKDSRQPHGDDDAEITTHRKPRGSNHAQPEVITAAKASTRATPELVVLPDRPEMEPITPERVKKPTPREQASSNRAKVPYRVGLSKRARIAPLLRTVRK